MWEIGNGMAVPYWNFQVPLTYYAVTQNSDLHECSQVWIIVIRNNMYSVNKRMRGEK
jgi:hypothetical protein